MGFVANFIHFPAVHKFWKSIKIWQTYREFNGGNFSKSPAEKNVGVNRHFQHIWSWQTVGCLLKYFNAMHCPI